MYLAAIYTSLQYKPNIFIIEIASPLNGGQDIVTINDLTTSFFPLEDEQEVKLLIGLGLFCVHGGNM